AQSLLTQKREIVLHLRMTGGRFLPCLAHRLDRERGNDLRIALREELVHQLLRAPDDGPNVPKGIVEVEANGADGRLDHWALCSGLWALGSGLRLESDARGRPPRLRDHTAALVY